MPDFSYWPFDVSGNSSDSQDETDDIFDALGITSWEEIALDNADSEPQYERPARYLTPEEALKDIYGRGISFFSRIRYLPDEDLYTVDIIYPE